MLGAAFFLRFLFFVGQTGLPLDLSGNFPFERGRFFCFAWISA